MPSRTLLSAPCCRRSMIPNPDSCRSSCRDLVWSPFHTRSTRFLPCNLQTNRQHCSIRCFTVKSVMPTNVLDIHVLTYICTSSSVGLGYAKYCDQHASMWRYVCLSARISQNHVQISRNFLYVFSVAIWFGHFQTIMQYVTYFRFCGWHHDHVFQERSGCLRLRACLLCVVVVT